MEKHNLQHLYWFDHGVGEQDSDTVEKQDENYGKHGHLFDPDIFAIFGGVIFNFFDFEVSGNILE